MSGYQLRTPYDATKKRQDYLRELELRTRLDDANLQANKIYKRTGAISTPPDTRTTTEKLADLYRLRIEMRTKLGKIMSGDDAQRVVNELDQQELIFLTQRIEKFITDLKPKYALGVPYQVFNTYFKNAIRDFNRFGELDASRAVLEELSGNTDETRYAIESLTREIQLAGKKEIIFKIENIDKLRNLIDRASFLLDSGAVNPSLEGQVTASIEAIEKVVPTKIDLAKLQIDFEKAIKSGDKQTQDKLVSDILGTATDIDTLKNNIDDLNKIIQETTQQLPQVPPSVSGKSNLPTLARYEEPYDPNYSYGVNVANELLTKLLDKVYVDKNPMVIELWKNKLLPSLQDIGVDASRMKSGSSLRQKIAKESGEGMNGVNLWIDYNADVFKQIFLIEERELPIAQNPFLKSFVQGTDIYGGLPSTFGQLNPTGISSGLTSQPIPIAQPTAQPAPPIPPTTQPTAPTAKPTITILSNGEIAKLFEQLYLKTQYMKSKGSLIRYLLSNQDVANLELSQDNLQEFQKNFSLMYYDQIKNFVKTKDATYFDDPTNLTNLVQALDNYTVDEVNVIAQSIIDASNAGNPLPLGPYTPTNQLSTIYGGSIKMKKSSVRMGGKGVAIDYTAGIATDGKRKTNYVPFGKYIINRDKLNDGIVMIKRTNGAFMGDVQSRRVSNKLRNVFEKIVGGAVPTYNDYNKLDEDEKEYLHFVAKKSNLLDKLEVPTPKKDDDEKMMNRFDILRGMIMAGNDNKQMLDEFKKLILDMADKKLLPRRQVSDILIDIERLY